MSASQLSLFALLHRANQIATERFAASLGGADLTARQVQVLAAIDANEGLSQTDIVNMTGIDRSTLTDIVRRLQKRKLIERRRSKHDARAYVVKLTEAGKHKLDTGRPALGSVEKDLMAALPTRQRVELLAILGKIVTSDAERSADDGRADTNLRPLP